MTLRVTLELSDKDLRHYRKVMKESRQHLADASQEEVIAAAHELLESVRGTITTEFVLTRLEKLEVMIAMLVDEQWQIPDRERKRVITALSYFADPHDLIDDALPVLGLLDDAIMIELVVRELRHEIEAYEDFCEFRKREKIKPEVDADDETADRLSRKRKALHERMRRRGSRRRRANRGSSGPRISLF